MKLVEYGKRPVPLERHLVFARSEYDKEDLMSRLSRQEYKNVSKKVSTVRPLFSRIPGEKPIQSQII